MPGLARSAVLALACVGMLSAVFWEESEMLLGWAVRHGLPHHQHAGSFEDCPVVGRSRAAESAETMLLSALDLDGLPSRTTPWEPPEDKSTTLEALAPEELDFYDGKSSSRVALIAVAGSVFDVSSVQSRMPFLLGRDITAELSEAQLATWVQELGTRFPVVAALDATPESTVASDTKTSCEGDAVFTREAIDDLESLRRGLILAELEDGRILDVSSADWLYGEHGARYALHPRGPAVNLYPCLGRCCADTESEGSKA